MMNVRPSTLLRSFRLTGAPSVNVASSRAPRQLGLTPLPNYTIRKTCALSCASFCTKHALLSRSRSSDHRARAPSARGERAPCIPLCLMPAHRTRLPPTAAAHVATAASWTGFNGRVAPLASALACMRRSVRSLPAACPSSHAPGRQDILCRARPRRS
jgi:hypothetical protein